MEEIKFRAWDKTWKKMGNVTQLDLPHNDRDFILMQYTGLKDNNDKKIYEGDILKHEFCYPGIGKVIYEAPSFRVIGDDNDIWLGHCAKNRRKVIGNIYENPELLKEKI